MKSFGEGESFQKEARLKNGKQSILSLLKVLYLCDFFNLKHKVMIKGVFKTSVILLFVISASTVLRAQNMPFRTFKPTDSLQLKSYKLNFYPLKKNFIPVPITGNYSAEEKEKIMNPYNSIDMSDFLINGTLNGLINLFFEKKN